CRIQEAPAGAARVEPGCHRDQRPWLLRESRRGQGRHGSNGPRRGGCSRLGAAAGGGTSPAAVTYRAELSSRALGQLGGLLERRLMLSWPPCPGGSSTSMIRYGR